MYVGRDAGYYSTTGTNTAVGAYALVSTSGASPSGNSAFSYQALNVCSGNFNTGLGYQALRSNTTASNNTAVGYEAAKNNTTGEGFTAIGTQALEANTTGNYGVAVGWTAAYSNTTGQPVAIGTGALYAQTTPQNNTALGHNTLEATTTGDYNTGTGRKSLPDNTTGSYNTANGFEALALSTTGERNIAVGHQAGYNVTTGVRNTIVGERAGFSIQTSGYNTFIGQGAGYYITSGEKNTIIGTYSGNSGGLDIRTSNNNIVLSDGDGNPRMRVASGGDFYFGEGSISTPTSSPGNGSNVAGVGFASDGAETTARFWASGRADHGFNRFADGVVLSLRSAGAEEGSISISGTTCSFNGGHLSRWSQTTDNTRIDGLLKGTVMTNLDQMAVWGDEDNEQLNCMSVSSVEGDPNVAGVFVNWDEREDYTTDMNVAMTGDMIIRIAQGTTVARGDLLMSAGDGTAKPQGDDIVRSKTIAKVTSTHVTCTYDDGSYCVPCVLMAC